jgi:hypothetical protein
MRVPQAGAFDHLLAACEVSQISRNVTQRYLKGREIALLACRQLTPTFGM